MEEFNVLSLFDGMSCGQIALERCGINVSNYYASEIDKPAMYVTMNNYPNTIQLGDVCNVNINILPKIDLMVGGSPCQGFSYAGKQLNFNDERSKLFFEFVRLLKEVNPKYFLLENVKMAKQHEAVITEYLGVNPIRINSNLVSAQNRERLYWTNIPNVSAPEDKGIMLIDILEELPDCPIGIKVRNKTNCLRVGGRNSPFGSKQIWDSPFQRVSKNGKIKPGINKAACLTGGAHSGGNHSDMDIIHSPFCTRRYSPIECEKLQNVPAHYTKGVSNSQRYKMLGNGWTVDVLSHIFSFIK
jgi:DNA (cytosine-5)-methyltransferase 3A